MFDNEFTVEDLECLKEEMKDGKCDDLFSAFGIVINVKRCHNIYDIVKCFEGTKITCFYCFENDFTRTDFSSPIQVENLIVRLPNDGSRSADFPANLYFMKNIKYLRVVIFAKEKGQQPIVSIDPTHFTSLEKVQFCYHSRNTYRY